MITRYGIGNFIILIIIGLLSLTGAYFLINFWVLSILFALIGIYIIFIAFWFFRDPERKIPEEALNDKRIILSPADGTIMEIVDDFEPNYFQEKTKRISIFLSPMDVHVNRIPATGVIEYFKFTQGRKLIASKNEASTQNQQTLFGLHNHYGKVLFKQIVGILARRLVWDIKVGDNVTIGERFGMMKFGSRMDIHLPVNSEIITQVGDKVVAANTILAKLPEQISKYEN
jgi:phosphatidylserine decarboxylase